MQISGINGMNNISSIYTYGNSHFNQIQNNPVTPVTKVKSTQPVDGRHNEKQNIQIIHIILDTLQEMLPDGDPRKELVSDKLITYVTDRKGHDRRYAIAPDKIKAEIGWYPETMFAEGIKKTIQWFFEHEDWMKNVTSGDYQKYYEDMYQNR